MQVSCHEFEKGQSLRQMEEFIGLWCDASNMVFTLVVGSVTMKVGTYYSAIIIFKCQQ
jgi:hypothetical protein